MSKWSKRLLGLAAMGSAIAGLVYYLKKSDSPNEEDMTDDFEDEDFDLDHDLKPVSDREYVPLNTQPKTDEADKEEADEADVKIAEEAEDAEEVDATGEDETSEEAVETEEKTEEAETEDAEA